MFLERLYDEDLAQTAYLIGCESSREAVVVDPLRDPQRYLDAAGRLGLRIVAVTETHIHADFLSGSRDLASAAGAELFVSGEGSGDWAYRFEGKRLTDGSTLRVGQVMLKALHTPGHTPEHLSFLVTDHAVADEPGYLLTGDFVLVGDVGRPDLLDEAGGESNTRFDAARLLFVSLRDRFLGLPDYLQVLPGHGAGSACGKSLGAVPSTTVGYERRFSWWAPLVERGDEETFSRTLLEGQPEVPTYFGRMKRLNRDGPAPLNSDRTLERVPGEELGRLLDQGALLLDTRASSQYLQDAVARSVHVPAGGRFSTYASYALDPEGDSRPLYLLAGDGAQAETLRRRLELIGVDDVRGYTESLAGLRRRRVERIQPERLDSLDGPFILDVRSRAEFETGHIPGARQLHLGRLAANLTELPHDRPIVVHCQGGGRAAVAASVLLASGFDQVIDLEGSFAAWSRFDGRRKGVTRG